MNANELNGFIENFPSISKNFLGTFSINTLPKNIPKRHFLFSNTDLDSEPGSHWLCFLRQNSSSVECFDSLGINDFKQNLLLTYCPYKNIKFNHTQFQPNESKSCGQFVIYFAVNRMHNLDLSFTDFLKEYFENNLEKNDKEVNDFFYFDN